MTLRNRELLRILSLGFALGGPCLLSIACDRDSDAENAAEEIGDAAEDAADEVEDALD